MCSQIDLNGRTVNARQMCSWYNFKGADQQKKASPMQWNPPSAHTRLTAWEHYDTAAPAVDCMPRMGAARHRLLGVALMVPVLLHTHLLGRLAQMPCR